MGDGLDWLGERGRDGGVDRVPLPGTRGSLWVCGKHVVGPAPEAALERCGAHAVVCLVEEHELASRYPQYVKWLRAAPPALALWFPIADLHAPGLDSGLGLIDELVERVSRGEVLLVHCGAGLGRAGTVAAAVLVALGLPPDEALDWVARHRPMAGPEAGSQRDFVEAVAARGDPRGIPPA